MLIIPQTSKTINTFLSRSSSVSRHPAKLGKKPYLVPEQFEQANKQKRMWLKAAIQECGLRGNEVIILEAITFLTDPKYGYGEPSIGAIHEKCLERVSSIG